MPRVFLIQPMHRDYGPIRMMLQSAAESLGAELVRADTLEWTGGAIVEEVYNQLESADLVVADVSQANPNVMYELGFVHGAERPVVLIADELPQVPFDIASLRFVRYGHDLGELATFRNEVSQVLAAALREPSSFARRPTTRQDVNRLFISYSHQDRAVLDRLLVHLKPLERENLIDAWNDTRIEAGSDWKREVEAALEHARAAILLVTADFLASDFIVDNELPPLLHNAENKGTAVIPVVVKPCRYTRDESLRRLQAINDPDQPLLSLTAVGQERLLDKVAATVERAMRPLE